MKKKKQLFELVISFEDNGDGFSTEISCRKDGQVASMGILDNEESLSIACEGMKYCTGMIARLYIETMHKNGTLSDDEYNKIMSGNTEEQ